MSKCLNALRICASIACAATVIGSTPIEITPEVFRTYPRNPRVVILCESGVIDTAERGGSPEAHQVYELSNADCEILKRIAQAEATGGGVKDKALVMQVVLNRVYSDEFGASTVKDVVFEDGQFSPISDGRYYSVIPDEDCQTALEAVISGEYVGCTATFFARTGLECWASRNREYMFTEWEHDFYR